jgi:hypothetical protein
MAALAISSAWTNTIGVANSASITSLVLSNLLANRRSVHGIVAFEYFGIS